MIIDIIDRDSATVAGNRLTVRTGRTTAVYTLPRGARRVVLVELPGGGRSQLIIGGFRSVTVVVNGPPALIGRLRKGVLG